MGNTPTAMIVVNTGIDAVVTHGLVAELEPVTATPTPSDNRTAWDPLPG